jgi:hypothetical protein
VTDPRAALDRLLAMWHDRVRTFDDKGMPGGGVLTVAIVELEDLLAAGWTPPTTDDGPGLAAAIKALCDEHPVHVRTARLRDALATDAILSANAAPAPPYRTSPEAEDGPGTPLGIIKAMFDAAEERGHPKTSSKHALSFLVDGLDATRAELDQLRARIEALCDEADAALTSEGRPHNRFVRRIRAALTPAETPR